MTGRLAGQIKSEHDHAPLHGTHMTHACINAWGDKTIMHANACYMHVFAWHMLHVYIHTLIMKVYWYIEAHNFSGFYSKR